MITRLNQFLNESIETASANLDTFKSARLTSRDLVSFRLISLGAMTNIRHYGFLYNGYIYSKRGIFSAATTKYSLSRHAVDVYKFQQMIYDELVQKIAVKKKSDDDLSKQEQFGQWLDTKFKKIEAADLEVGNTIRIYYPDYQTLSHTIQYADFVVTKIDAPWVDGKFIAGDTPNLEGELESGENTPEILRGPEYGEILK